MFSFSGCFWAFDDNCQVTEVGSNTTKKCIFPFWHRDYNLRFGCIADERPDFIGKFWCSTNVDFFQKHISGGGYWGHCGQNCYIDYENAGGWLPKM
jgi:hypothetical protein